MEKVRTELNPKIYPCPFLRKRARMEMHIGFDFAAWIVLK